MKTIEEMISIIYEKMSDKDYVFGCRYIYKVKHQHYRSVRGISKNHKTNEYLVEHEQNYFHPRKIKGSDIITKLGHPVYIGDILGYIDRNLFINPSKYEGVFEIDIQSREKCVITLYNHFIGKYRSPVEKLDDNAIEYIYNLITK